MRFQPLALLSCLLSISSLLSAAEKTIYGRNEDVLLPKLKLEVKAKLDTGAKTASLSTRDIRRFKRDGKTWVRFYLAIDNAHSHPIERPLIRISKIKRRSGDYDPEEDKTYTARPVVGLELCMGQALRTIEVNLTDRTAFRYPLLIGADALAQFGAVVDPSIKYAAGKPGCTTVANSAE